eukprot:CAMPEP_0195028644 /NCGR_PEP_ID=MMETSP0326_2-20130528/54899_1 /TAXON_ID=2866 ORGANISM="Crypthecodinium cohnii, Strain Seligo" /NCGR_SAMPLE_ID=MMETSP0326_2 /ASSEMBLY_ACC=CAM_ASM_000348 /LENGTH=38 /DNA_ID= /DNA_START= /DNA_END= /DNA_ORIENTATION=
MRRVSLQSSKSTQSFTFGKRRWNWQKQAMQEMQGVCDA